MEINQEGNQEGIQKSVHVVKKQEGSTIGEMIEKMKPQLEKALPKHLTAERLARVVLTAVRTNKEFQKCDTVSLMGAIMMSAQLGIEPNTPLGQAYLIPYGGQVQFQLGYKGILDLAYRSGKYKTIGAYSVDENDVFTYEIGLNPVMKHAPSKTPSGKCPFYYAVYHLLNGGSDFRVWSREMVEAHAKKYSKGFGNSSSPWKTNFNSMAKKTALIDLLKYAPMSIEVANAVSFDNMHGKISPDDPDGNLDIVGEFTQE